MGLLLPVLGERNAGSEASRYGRCGSPYLPVAHVIRAGVVDLDDDKHVLEVRADVFGSKWKGPGFLEHDGDDVIADVALPQQL